MAIKACKECHAAVSTDAQACPHCGKRRPTSTMTVGRALLIVLGVIVGLNVIGYMTYPAGSATTASTTRTPPRPAAPPIEIGARALWQEYQANEVAADARYKGRILLVSGVVQAIEKDFTDAMIVRLYSPNQFMATHAYLAPSQASVAAQLERGAKVTVLCNGDGLMMGSPILQDCVVQ